MTTCLFKKYNNFQMNLELWLKKNGSKLDMGGGIILLSGSQMSLPMLNFLLCFGSICAIAL